MALVAISQRLGVDSDPIAMLDESLPFRQTDERLRQQFPQLDSNLLVVIDAPTPEQAWLAAREVRDRLTAMPERIEQVSWPAGSDFFIDNGLLFQSPEALEALADRLGEAQPLLGRLAENTSATALLELLRQIDSRRDELPPGVDLASLHARLADVLDRVRAGDDALLSWQALLGEPADSGREALLVTPILDHTRVLAAREVMTKLNALRAELGLDQGPVRMRLTGSSALRHEEMQSVIDGAALTGALALALVTAVMLVGLRSLRLSLIALANLALGLILTTGFAALAVGRVNLISVSFVVLYIGLGVNYAVHYLLRYREIARHEDPSETGRLRAVIAAGRFLLRALALSALTTALGFFAFVPTDFSGIAQLGLIAGAAMLITLLLSYTALPAMLALVQPQVGGAVDDSDRGWRRALDAPLKYRAGVLVLGAVLLALSAPLLPRVGFDSDPLNVRDPDSESVIAIRELLREREAGYRNIQVLVAPDRDPEPLRTQLAALPSVERALSLDSFVPDDQTEKLILIEDLGWLLGPAIIESDWQPDPVALEALAESARTLAGALNRADPAAGLLADALVELAGDLETESATGLAARVNHALVGGLEPTLGRMSRGLRAQQPVTRADLPGWFAKQWRGRDGTQLIQVFPAVDVLQPGAQDRFAAAVQELAGGNATGGPVIQQAAGVAITRAFRQALIWAVVGIALVLLITLRRVRDAAMVMAPLALGSAVTLALMAVLGLQFNFANVVALPLLLGVAVDNGIHLVERHRAGLLPDGNVLRTATARAIVVGAMITAGGFGNLAFSPHAGTASLGVILAIGLSMMVVATLVFLPAMLGRGR